MLQVAQDLANLLQRSDSAQTVSGTTAYNVVTDTEVHQWDTVAAVVEVLARKPPGSDDDHVRTELARFHRLWMSAWSEEPSPETAAADALAVTCKITGFVKAAPAPDAAWLYRTFLQAVVSIAHTHGAAEITAEGSWMTAVFTGPRKAAAAAQCALMIDSVIEAVIHPAARTKITPLLGRLQLSRAAAAADGKPAIFRSVCQTGDGEG
ncbi:hypothetical protein OHB39_03525 [Streptomyces sp. NBC_00047]|uniref:hypothetical protein n=1 Tax=Streptomyces sp. NBC_00047 TaxID=2975627 RepID=UPI00225466FA|nr:hypothetical protein [Streptomyces sp. NBC_00047]MCX5606667.1 hypothetical protein [Streptomyces sp. NBC_00047]